MELKIDDADVAKITTEIAEAVVKALIPLLAQRQASPEEDFFDVPSLAAFLKVDASWIYQQVHNRKIPFYKVGKYTRFKRSEIEAWLTQQKCEKRLGAR